MSKSLGTGIDPLELIDGGERPPVYAEGGEFPAYGADALRFGLMAMSSSQDVRFNEERVRQGRDLAEQALERVAARAHRVSATPTPTRARPRRWRTAGSCRASSASPRA